MFLFLPGCWSGHELADQLIVLGISLDKVNGQIRLTLQGIRSESSVTSGSGTSSGAGSSSNSSSTGGDTQSKFFLLSADGNSVQEALQKIDRLTPRFLYYGHNQVFFIGEDLAKSGIMPYLDLFARDQWSQESSWIIIAEGETGQKLLTTTNLLVKYPSMGLAELVRKHQIQIPTLFHFLLNYHGDSGAQILVSAHGITNATSPPGYRINQLSLHTDALIQGDRLMGYLNNSDAETYDWLKNGFQEASLSFPLSQGQDSPLVGVSLSGEPATFRISDSPELRISLEMICDFTVTENPEGHLNSPADIRELENKLDDFLNQRFEQLFTHLKENKADVFDLAKKVHAYQLPLWQKEQSNWPEVYAELPIDIVVNSHFRNSSIMQKYPGLKE